MTPARRVRPEPVPRVPTIAQEELDIKIRRVKGVEALLHGPAKEVIIGEWRNPPLSGRGRGGTMHSRTNDGYQCTRSYR